MAATVDIFGLSTTAREVIARTVTDSGTATDTPSTILQGASAASIDIFDLHVVGGVITSAPGRNATIDIFELTAPGSTTVAVTADTYYRTINDTGTATDMTDPQISEVDDSLTDSGTATDSVGWVLIPGETAPGTTSVWVEGTGWVASGSRLVWFDGAWR